MWGGGGGLREDELGEEGEVSILIKLSELIYFTICSLLQLGIDMLPNAT